MIGTKNEMSLHASLKEFYRRPGDLLEEPVDNYIIDLVQKNRLVEIQTKNFSALKAKLEQLLKNHKVHLVHPVSRQRCLVYLDPHTKEVIRRRKSPKKGGWYDLFSELIRIPHLICNKNLSVEVVLVHDEEIRCDDGQGSWRRRGISIVDRCLIGVLEQRIFAEPQDFLKLIPVELESPFSNRNLARKAGISIGLARKLTYTFRKAGLLREVGKNGNEILHALAK